MTIYYTWEEILRMLCERIYDSEGYEVKPEDIKLKYISEHVGQVESDLYEKISSVEVAIRVPKVVRK